MIDLRIVIDFVEKCFEVFLYTLTTSDPVFCIVLYHNFSISYSVLIIKTPEFLHHTRIVFFSKKAFIYASFSNIDISLVLSQYICNYGPWGLD